MTFAWNFVAERAIGGKGREAGLNGSDDLRKENDRLRTENEVLHRRMSALGSAVLRVGASLDPDTVLREIVDNARALTGARYGVIATADRNGQPRDFLTSGLTADEQGLLLQWPDGHGFFEHLRNLAGPLRQPDLPAWILSLGRSAFPIQCGAFQATPMRHGDVYAGGFFLGGKDGGFTDADEEALVLFAAQAAAAIANARAHRDERRTRAELDALVEISPVGIVVFDASTGLPRSLNREARRIVAELQISDRSPEELLDLLTCRRSDGREVTLYDLRNAETVQAEEVVLSVPDGRSVTMLVSAAPIPSDGGGILSTVVTMQDLAPLQEVERLRTEFLSLVSHELRAPLTSIKGSASTVLGTQPDLDPAEMREFFRIVDQQADHMHGLIGDLLDAGRIETGTLSVTPEPAEVADLVEQARTAFLSGGGRHTVTVDLPPDLPRAMADRRRIVQVLNNLFSNAARHSPEALPILVAAASEGAHVAISVSDEGEGVPPDRLPHLFRKYARYREAGAEDGAGLGSGLGLAICKGLVEAHGGRIRAESGGTGKGTRFTFTIPTAGAAGEGAAAGSRGSAPRSVREGQDRVCILVVDDDPQTTRYVRNALEAAGYAAEVTGDPGEVARLVRTKRPRLVLLDLMLPGTDGIELMEAVPELADLPVIFISGYHRDETVAAALENGAVDYIVKPFSSTELNARVGAALRRQEGPERFRLKDLTIDYHHREVSVAGRPVEMTATEYELLRILSINAGRVVTNEALLRQVWGDRDSGGPALLRTFVKKLRRKLGDRAKQPAYILTARAVGYRMAKPDAS